MYKFKHDYIVVGAGLTGVTFAREKAEVGFSVLVIDKEPFIGGMCMDTIISGINVHESGPHIFHTNNTTAFNFISRFTRLNNYEHKVQAIGNNNKTYNLPFNMDTLYSIYPDILESDDPIEYVKSGKFLKGVKYDNPKNLEEQAINSLGKKCYNILIEHYSKKQWGIDCSKISANVISRIPLRYNHDSTYFNNHKYQGIPKYSYSNMINNILDHKDIDILLSTTFSDIKNKISETTKILYTGSVDELHNYCYGVLEYRSIRLEHTTYNLKRYQECAVINDCTETNPYTRTIEHKQFDSSCEVDYTIVSKEYSNTFKPGLNKPHYPISNPNNTLLLSKYLKLTKKMYGDNIEMLGRLGTYKYIDMDEAIIKAIQKSKSF